jgi:asparagine synthase (glutamine-hydrolysing)
MKRWETKLVLLAALRDLVPEAVLTRSKMGFPVPFGSWVRGAFRSTLDEYLLSPRAMERNLFKPGTVRRIVDEHVTGARSHADRLWLLVNLELWLRMAIDGEEAPPLDAPLDARMDRSAVSA